VTNWDDVRARRLEEPGARTEYAAAGLAYRLGKAVRDLREARHWSQAELGRRAAMTQSAVARFEAGGTTPTLPILERFARALGVELHVGFTDANPVA
jgi:ribosome-binding protein aMBF1 (putative translation factor)